MSSVEISRLHKSSAPLRGFGLIELVIALAIVAILAAVALPSFRELGMRMTVSTHTNDLVGALNTARAEAAKRGTAVAVIGSGNNWTAGGWRVVADSNHDGVFSVADTDLSTYGAVDNGYAVKTKVTGGASDAQIVFGPQGSLASPATRADINVCRPDGHAVQSAWIAISPSGEISSHRDTTGSFAPAC